MANVNKPFGFRPVGKTGSNYDNQGLTQYKISNNYNTNLFQGDAVTLSGGYLAIATAGNPVVGVFQGCYYVDPTSGKPTWKNYYPGSVNITAGKIMADVIDDPSQLFIVQVDESVAQTDVGKNADVVGTGGSTTTGVSTMELDSSTIAKTAALNLKIVGLWDVPGNEFGTNAVVVVKINEHLYGSAGVAGQGA